MLYDERKYIRLFKRLVKSIVIMGGIIIIFNVVALYITIMCLPIDTLDTSTAIDFFARIVFFSVVSIVLMVLLSVNWISIFLKYSIDDIKRYQTDVLTGLKRRRVLVDQKMLVEYEEGLGIIYMDVNNFKLLNDKYGHHFGDMVLVTISKQLLDIENEYECVNAYRMGGDEFVLTVLTGDIMLFTKVIDLLKEKVGQVDINPIGSISISIGTAYKKGNIDLELLIDIADERMYEDKRRYKNNVD